MGRWGCGLPDDAARLGTGERPNGQTDPDATSGWIEKHFMNGTMPEQKTAK
jgi:hypothetical protein